ncbi:hypothetical protein [Epilithonimonas sp.]|uniref:hypothetical protein n=1 Tax=Epilithonimonas sp. TaxID=2894511 RepID=UPI0035B0B61E
MNKILTILLLFVGTFCFSQNKSVDELTDEMCVSFNINKNLSDSLRLLILNEKFILPYLNQFDESEKESLSNQLYFRFQKNCKAFVDYLYQIDPPKKDDWIKLDSPPEIKITDKELTFLKRTKKFYYYEWEGEKTKVTTTDKYWIEQFSDKTYSKLKLIWLTSNSFQLEFIESNNNGRKNFSKPGDKYLYEVVSKEKDYFWVLAKIPEQPQLLMFKLFYK